MGFISACLDRTRLDGAVGLFTVLMYLCSVEMFLLSVLGYCSATVVTDNHPVLYLSIDTVSLVREQFLRLALTSKTIN
jgi:hypothetical protein